MHHINFNSLICRDHVLLFGELFIFAYLIFLQRICWLLTAAVAHYPCTPQSFCSFICKLLQLHCIKVSVLMWLRENTKSGAMVTISHNLKAFLQSDIFCTISQLAISWVFMNMHRWDTDETLPQYYRNTTASFLFHLFFYNQQEMDYIEGSAHITILAPWNWHCVA